MYWDNVFPFIRNNNYFYQDYINYTFNDTNYHSITVVGWDDNYPHSNFCFQDNIGDGAFIIKNSWGNLTGDDGYYYVSYYDELF